jgi:chemotaxis protein MotB
MIRSDSNRKRGDSDEKDTNGWMITFSDLCTLLLTFFVLLFSLSSLDNKKLKISFRNFGVGSGILSFKEYREIAQPMETLIEDITKMYGKRVTIGKYTDLPETDIDTNELETLGNFLAMQQIEEGLRLTFKEEILFSSGSSDLMNEMMPVLDKIARFIMISGYQTYIDGHTDSVPVQAERFNSNEDLSVARAMSIRKYLLLQESISHDSIGLTGYGALKPISSNDLLEGRNKNRRVEIILKNRGYF